MKKVVAMIMTVLIGACLLAGCGKSNNIWEIKFGSAKLNMDQSFEGLVSDIIDSGNKPIDFQQSKIYEKDGSFSDTKVDYLEEKKDNWVLLAHKKGAEEELNVLTLNMAQDSLKHFKSADGFGPETKESSLPKKYVTLGECNAGGWNRRNGISNYCVLVIDGQYVDISNYLNDKPDTLTDEYLDRLNAVQLSSEEYGLMPDYFRAINIEDAESYYNSDEYFRNATAFGIAIDDAVKRIKSGEIKTLGSISYTYEDGKMVSCEFKILRKR